MPNDEKKYFGLLALDKHTNEVLHYAENSDIKISDIANWGVYFISVRIFAEYGMCPYQDNDNDGSMIYTANILIIYLFRLFARR